MKKEEEDAFSKLSDELASDAMELDLFLRKTSDKLDDIVLDKRIKKLINKLYRSDCKVKKSVATIMNSIATQRVGCFFMSTRGMISLTKKDKNNTKSLSNSFDCYLVIKLCIKSKVLIKHIDQEVRMSAAYCLSDAFSSRLDLIDLEENVEMCNSLYLEKRDVIPFSRNKKGAEDISKKIEEVKTNLEEKSALDRLIEERAKEQKEQKQTKREQDELQRRWNN